jgi:hypothetical protein
MSQLSLENKEIMLESDKRHRQKEGYQSPSRSHQRSSRIDNVGES